MPFVADIAKLSSLAIVGMAKNTGKTETLNYVLSRLADYSELSIALTSIGIDGEKRDQVTQTDKPEIFLRSGTIFVTAEKYYLTKQVPSEILDIDYRYLTSIGRAIYAKARGKGKVLLAGPSTTGGLRYLIKKMRNYGVDLTIIDGALARMSLASPSVAEGVILATGAAYSAQPDKLIRDTQALHRLISLDEYSLPELIDADSKDLWYYTDQDGWLSLGTSSALLGETWEKAAWLRDVEAIYIAGVVTDRMMNTLKGLKKLRCLIAKDFTHFFASPLAVSSFLNSGKELAVRYATKLIAVTFNPLSPTGYRLKSDEMCARLEKALNMPVYDVKQRS